MHAQVPRRDERQRTLIAARTNTPHRKSATPDITPTTNTAALSSNTKLTKARHIQSERRCTA